MCLSGLALLLLLGVAVLQPGCGSTCTRHGSRDDPMVQRCDECQPCEHGRGCRIGEHCVDGCCQLVDDENLLE